MDFWFRVSGFLLLAILLLPARAPAADLRLIHTQHYEIHTDLDPAFANELAKRMDVMYEEYEKRLKDFRPPKTAPPLPAYLFTKQEDYLQFAGPRATNTGGLFAVEPDRTFLATFLNGQGRDSVRRTLQHEAFHQFAYAAISKDLPIWLNEGLAQIFEEGIWTGQKFLIGQVPPRRIRQLNADIQDHHLVNFKEFLSITPDEWGHNLNADANKGATYYNQAWAMVQFLGETGRPQYLTLLTNYLKQLHNGEDPEAANAQSFSKNLAAIQDDFSDWARTLQPTPEATVLERQDTLGDLLALLSKQHRHFADMTQFRNTIVSNGYKVTYTRGLIKWSTSDTPQIYFSNLNGNLYSPGDLFFQNSPRAPLPDIVCHATRQIELRTHFYKAEKEIEHEVLIEPIGR